MCTVQPLITAPHTHTSPLFLVLCPSPFPFPHMYLQYALEFFTGCPPLSPPSSLPTFLLSHTEVTSTVSLPGSLTCTLSPFSLTHIEPVQHTTHPSPSSPVPQHTHTHTHRLNPWTTSVTTDPSKVGLHMLYPCILWIHPTWQSNPKCMSQLECWAHGPMEHLR